MSALAPSFLVRRMRSSWQLLSCVAVTGLVVAALLSALVSFSAQALPQAVRHQLASSAALSLTVIGIGDQHAMQTGSHAIRREMQGALGNGSYQLFASPFTDPLRITAPAHGKSALPAEAAAPAAIESYGVLTSGSWPGQPQSGQPVPVAVPAQAAAQLQLHPGSLLTTRDTNSRQTVSFLVTGIYRQRDSGSPYWGLDAIWTCSASTLKCFTAHGPLVVSPAAFGAGGLAVDQASWVVLPDAASLRPATLTAAAARVTAAERRLHSSGAGGLVTSSGLPKLLTGTARSLTVARSLLVIAALELLLLAGVALALASRLLATHREEESALLTARGAARSQLTRPALAEGILVSAIAAAVGVLAGGRLAGLLVRTGQLAGARLRISGIPADAWLAGLAVVALCTATMLWPMLRPAAPGAARASRGRQAALARTAEAGGDVLLLALAGLAVWELRTYSAVSPSISGVLGIDPVLALGPALALAGVSLIVLRAVPLLARFIDRATAAGRRLSAALAGWEISRRPVRQSGPVLLAVLAVATGTLTLAQYQSWQRSAADQAAFATGTDVRVDPLFPLAPAQEGAVRHSPGVLSAMPVSQADLAPGQLVALDARQAPGTVLLRKDQSSQPAASLWRQITPRRPAAGPALPGTAGSLRLTAKLAAPPGSRLAAASVTVSVQQSDGTVYQRPAGVLPADGRSHELTAQLVAGSPADGQPRLAGLSFSYLLEVSKPRAPAPPKAPATLQVTALATTPAGSGGGAARQLASGSSLRSWPVTVSSPELANLGAVTSGPGAAVDPKLISWQGAGSTGLLSFRPGREPAPQPGHLPPPIHGVIQLTPALPGQLLPAIATQAFLQSTKASVGTVLPAQAGGQAIRVRIVAAITRFPTVTDPGGALIVDQAALQRLLVAVGDQPLPVTSWWLRTATGELPPGLPAAAVVTDRASVTAKLLSSPVLDSPQQAALAIAAAAALLAALGFAVSVAASLRARRRQSALLAALGVSRPAQAVQLCLEEVMLSLPAALVGLLAGAGLAELLVPAVTLTSGGTKPLPPAVVVVPVSLAGWLGLLVAAIPVLVAALTVIRRPDPAAQLRAAEAA
ncbi:MAG TPA: ABC transporter permease [Streptosporangiaceae bacterium]